MKAKSGLFVQANPEFHEIYNACVSLVNRFRKTHLGYAAAYIQKQHQDSANNPTAVGTGGTPFMDYLKKEISPLRASLTY